MHVMSKAGLGDIYRKIHGNKARSYTRSCNTVRTRLDRIYATEYSSGKVWHAHWLDATYAKWIKTDHIPVIAEMSILGKSKSDPNRTRINKEVYDDPEVRSRMQEIILEINEEHKGDDQAVNIWEEIKRRAYAMLIEETTCATR